MVDGSSGINLLNVLELFQEWRIKCVKPQSPQRLKSFLLNGLSALCGEEGFILTLLATPTLSIASIGFAKSNFLPIDRT
jgi:hypothetical protein